VKVEHRHPTILLHPLPIQKKKWEVTTINFIHKLPRIKKQHDSRMVVADKLTKDVHFVLVKMTHTSSEILQNLLEGDC